MTSPKVILLPGQGAQFIGMGKAWFDASPEARAVFAEADEALYGKLPAGAKLSDLCFGVAGGPELLNRTDVSQPAIYTASVACWRGMLAKMSAGMGSGVSETGVVATAGLSLGEYTALHIAGAFSFVDGLNLVALRGRAMQDAAEASSGGMVALIGADEAQAKQVCAEALVGGKSSEVLVCANFNAPGQIVISGSKAACDRAAAADGPATKLGLRATVLPVAGAFHSPLMAPAAERLRSTLDKTAVGNLRCEVIANVTAKPHQSGASGIRQRLYEQLTAPVRWAESCTLLATTHGPTAGIEFHELAPGKSLAGLFRRIDKSIKVITHDEPA